MSGHAHIETPSSMSSVGEVDEIMTTLELGDRVGVLVSFAKPPNKWNTSLASKIECFKRI